MGKFVNIIMDALRNFFIALKEFVQKIIQGIISFVQEIVNNFKTLSLVRNRDIPFIANTEQLKDLIKNAPVKNVGIFEATYNQQTDEIENARYLAADEIDEETQEVLGNEKLVVLS